LKAKKAKNDADVAISSADSLSRAEELKKYIDSLKKKNI
jgi:hypothetical protein